MKEAIRSATLRALASIGIAARDVIVEHPAELSHGDYATSVALQYAKQAGLSPRVLAEKLVAALGSIDGVSKIEIAGPGFINFTLAPEVLATSLGTARTEDMWGANTTLAGKKIMVEYTDPNPFKEFHIGHLMSNAIGESIARLFEYSGADEVRRVCYQGDVGLHVAKAMYVLLEQEQLGKLQRPSMSLQDIGDAYVQGSSRYETNATDKSRIDELNVALYRYLDNRFFGKPNDAAFVPSYALYEQAKDECLKHFSEIYELLGTDFRRFFFESDSGPRGLEIVRAHPEVFELSENAIVYRGEKDGLHTRVFITSKGVPTYETKDIGLAHLKVEYWPACDISVTVTAQEQADYFAVMVAALRRIAPNIAVKIKHITHGMMRFAEGKMSSRKGNIVTGESLLRELKESALKRAIESRNDNPLLLGDQIAVAAIKYQILKQASHKDIVFDRERALSLEGDSGPYLQYAHARARSLLERARDAKPVHQMKVERDQDIFEVGTAYLLSRIVYRFPEVVERAAREFEPHYVTTYLTELAALFSRWYATERIIVDGQILQHRAMLIEAVARTMGNGLRILGIPAPEKM